MGLQNVFTTFRGPMVFLDLVPFFKSFRNSRKHPTPQPINFQNIATTVTKNTHQVITSMSPKNHFQVMSCCATFDLFFQPKEFPSCEMLVESTSDAHVHNLGATSTSRRFGSLPPSPFSNGLRFSFRCTFTQKYQKSSRLLKIAYAYPVFCRWSGSC